MDKIYSFEPGTIFKITLDDIELFYEFDHVEGRIVYVKFEVVHDGEDWNVVNSYLYHGLKGISQESWGLFALELDKITTNISDDELKLYKKALTDDARGYLEFFKRDIKRIEERIEVITKFLKNNED